MTEHAVQHLRYAFETAVRTYEFATAQRTPDPSRIYLAASKAYRTARYLAARDPSRDWQMEVDLWVTRRNTAAAALNRSGWV